MMEVWRKIRLGDACVTNIASYSLREGWKFVNYLDTGNITDNRIGSIQYIDVENEKLPSRARRKVKKNSIIYSTVRPNQRHFGIIKIQPENFLVSTGFAVIDVDAEVLDADFLYYLLTQPTLVEALHALAEQSTSAYPSIKPSDIEDLEIEIPELAMQKKIADILGVLDRKIIQNTEINKNLEEQAQLLFTDRFVANNYTVAQEAKIGDICKCILGGTPSRAKAEYWGGPIPWINSGEINRFRIISPSELITQSGLDHSATKMLPAKTTVLAITGATLGQVSLLEIDACANQSVVGIIPNDTLPYEFIYPFIKAKINELISHQTGGAQQHINKQNVERLPVSMPTRDLLYDFVTLVSPMYSMIASNCFENMQLENMRDSLLPQLMSGELDVSDIDL